MKKFEDIEDIDIILEEQKLSKDTSVAHFRINKKMFEIDPNDVKVIETIGQGGGSAVVYSAKWNNLIIAYKCFTIHEYLEDKFAEFEKEVELLSSISFPYILTFYGATLSSQRLGLVMEFAENGDMENFLRSYHKKNNKSYSFDEKIRMLCEISSSMAFLHSKKVIHRDLKPLNVLVTKKEETKLMDFGLSKIIDNDLTKTKKVGTSFYMAPEVVVGQYSFPCDVFSFAMLMFVILTEEYSPFGKKSEYTIFNKISKDPNFRLNLESLEGIGNKSDIEVIQRLIKLNWDHEPSKRMKFEEINKEIEELRKNKKKKDLDMQFIKEELKELKKSYQLLEEKNKNLEKRNAELVGEIERIKKEKKN